MEWLNNKMKMLNAKMVNWKVKALLPKYKAMRRVKIREKVGHGKSIQEVKHLLTKSSRREQRK